MCDVPSIAVFCSETIKCFPGTASNYYYYYYYYSCHRCYHQQRAGENDSEKPHNLHS
jgi:hypothetical protein